MVLYLLLSAIEKRVYMSKNLRIFYMNHNRIDSSNFRSSFHTYVHQFIPSKHKTSSTKCTIEKYLQINSVATNKWLIIS